MGERQRKSEPAEPRNNGTEDRRQTQGRPTDPFLGDGLEGRDAGHAAINAPCRGNQAESAVQAFCDGRAGGESGVLGRAVVVR